MFLMLKKKKEEEDGASRLFFYSLTGCTLKDENGVFFFVFVCLFVCCQSENDTETKPVGSNNLKPHQLSSLNET